MAIATIFGLSYFASIPYIYTVLGLAAWVFIGHLVTLDDDMPGEWSNPNNSKNFWRSSKIELLTKFLVVLGLLTITLVHPSIKEFGA